MNRERQSSSFSRRVAFAGDAWFLFDYLFSRRLLAPYARIGDSQWARLLDHAARVGFDLTECIRTLHRVPDIGAIELALLEATRPVPQHPRYLGYWHDPARHSMVGMLMGVDLIRHGGKYYVLELNHGPSIYARRRAMYDMPFDPIVSGIVSAGRAHGFETIVPIGFRWSAEYVEEWERAGRELGVAIEPVNCPLVQSGHPARLVALPDPLPEKTMYLIHSGLMTPLCRYVDNKWYAHKWLQQAIESELPSDTLLAIPPTRETFFFPDDDHGERWPNLVIKLAGGARSMQVIAGRFRDESEARETLGLTNGHTIPKQLRRGFVSSLLFTGRDRVLYQAFIPPMLDRDDRAQLLRLHLLISPLATTYLSAHLRVSRAPVPARVPQGILRRDHSFIINDCDYQLLPEELEGELRQIAAQLGTAIQSAVTQKFETTPAVGAPARQPATSAF